MASKFTPGIWVVTIKILYAHMLGGALGRYIQGGCYFQGGVNIIQRLWYRGTGGASPPCSP